MKKFLVFLVFALCIAGILIAIRAGLPKYTYMLPGFGILLLLDLYLWMSVSKGISRIRPAGRLLIGILYWIPFAAILVSVAAGAFIPFEQWNIPLRTYVTGIIAVVYVSKILPIFFLLAADLIRFIRFTAKNIMERGIVHLGSFPRWKFLVRTGWVLGLMLFLIFAWGMIFGLYDFRVRTVAITIPDLPSRFDGLRIAQISDIHLGSWPSASQLRKAMEMTNSVKPDVIFCTGDLVNFYTRDVNGYEGILRELQAPEGIFAIMGNHDYGDYLHWKDPESKTENLTELFELYKRLGWKLLMNDHYILTRGTDSLAIIGVENWGSYARFQRRADLGKAEEGIENMKVQLLLSHDPSYWDPFIYGKHPKIDITFSGHTHGFQFGIETGNILWSPFQRMYREWAGLYSRDLPGGGRQYIYVNRGLGTIGFPGRVGILPEITLIILRKK